MKDNLPLIDLTPHNPDIPPLWVYKNYAYVFDGYSKTYQRNYIDFIEIGIDIGPPLDNTLQIKKYDNHKELSSIYFIEDEHFQRIYSTEFDYNYGLEHSFELNNYSEFAVKCFSAKYELGENEIYNIKVDNFEIDELCPDVEKLNLVAKNYLRDLDYTISSKEDDLSEINKEDYGNYDKVFSFFYYHFNQYKGEPETFVKHSIELTNEVWKIGNLANKERKKCFESWVTFVNYRHSLDPSKFSLEPVTTSKPPQLNNDVQEPIKPTKKDLLLYFHFTKEKELFNNDTEFYGMITQMYGYSKQGMKNAKSELNDKIYLTDKDNLSRLTKLLEGKDDALKKLNDDLILYKIV